LNASILKFFLWVEPDHTRGRRRLVKTACAIPAKVAIQAAMATKTKPLGMAEIIGAPVTSASLWESEGTQLTY